jgi:hypothetical protein
LKVNHLATLVHSPASEEVGSLFPEKSTAAIELKLMGKLGAVSLATDRPKGPLVFTGFGGKTFLGSIL